ncbi:hypothetical protein BD413DRAFT_177839 [Trametes elegans]|nr:hypothetical protein BD413DRAFT_177839 [Trametes elegans]
MRKGMATQVGPKYPSYWARDARAGLLLCLQPAPLSPYVARPSMISTGHLHQDPASPGFSDHSKSGPSSSKLRASRRLCTVRDREATLTCVSPSCRRLSSCTWRRHAVSPSTSQLMSSSGTSQKPSVPNLCAGRTRTWRRHTRAAIAVRGPSTISTRSARNTTYTSNVRTQAVNEAPSPTACKRTYSSSASGAADWLGRTSS